MKLEVKDTDQPVVRRIKTSLIDGSLFIRIDILNERYVCSFSKKKLAEAELYITLFCGRKVSKTVRNFTGKYYEFEVYKKEKL